MFVVVVPKERKDKRNRDTVLGFVCANNFLHYSIVKTHGLTPNINMTKSYSDMPIEWVDRSG